MQINSQFLAAPSQIFVPVRAFGQKVVDNGGDVIAVCFTDTMAMLIAALINRDAGLENTNGD